MKTYTTPFEVNSLASLTYDLAKINEAASTASKNINQLKFLGSVYLDKEVQNKLYEAMSLLDKIADETTYTQAKKIAQTADFNQWITIKIPV